MATKYTESLLAIYYINHVDSSVSSSSGSEPNVLSVSSPLLVPGAGGRGSSLLLSLERLLSRGGGALLLGVVASSVGVALSLHDTRRWCDRCRIG